MSKSCNDNSGLLMRSFSTLACTALRCVIVSIFLLYCVKGGAAYRYEIRYRYEALRISFAAPNCYVSFVQFNCYCSLRIIGLVQSLSYRRPIHHNAPCTSADPAFTQVPLKTTATESKNILVGGGLPVGGKVEVIIFRQRADTPTTGCCQRKKSLR